MVINISAIMATFNGMPAISTGSLMQYKIPIIEKNMDGTQIQ